MTDTTISIRIDKELREKMRKMEYINWSALLRRALINELEKREEADKERMIRAFEGARKLRESGAFSSGKKTGTEIIRAWRNKKRF